MRWRVILDRIAIIAGGIGIWVYTMGGLFAIYAVPLQFAAKHPTALLSKPIVWLSAHTSNDAFLMIYSCTQLCIAGVLLYGIILFDFIRFRRLEPEGQSGRKEREAEK